jgi:hypothetical protein
VNLAAGVQAEEAAICDCVYRDQRASVHVSGPYSPVRKAGVHHFHRLVLDGWRPRRGAQVTTGLRMVILAIEITRANVSTNARSGRATSHSGSPADGGHILSMSTTSTCAQ